MRLFPIGLLFLGVVVFICCSDDTTKPTVSNEARLVLTADKVSGPAPLTVHFTGSLHGKIDTLVMCVPDMVLCPGYGKTCVFYCSPDTSQQAKRVYLAEAYYTSAGDYKAVMVLLSKHSYDIYSDSLAIHVMQ